MPTTVPRGQVVQVGAVDVHQHLRRRDLAQIAERAVGGALKMIQHHMRSHLLVVEALQAADLARVVHLRWFTGCHFQRVRDRLADPLEITIRRELKERDFVRSTYYRDRSCVSINSTDRSNLARINIP